MSNLQAQKPGNLRSLIPDYDALLDYVAAYTPANDGWFDCPVSRTDDEILYEIKYFLKALDSTADEFTFQTFDDSAKKRGSLAKIYTGTIDNLYGRLSQLNREGAGIFVTINKMEYRGNSRSNDLVTHFRAVWQDDDYGDAKETPIPPHLIIRSSPGKSQRYWLTELTPVDRRDASATEKHFAGIIKGIAKRYGGDPKVNDMCRVLRVPGFYHQKGTPHLVHMISVNDVPRYTWDEIEKTFPPLTRNSTPRGDKATAEGTEGFSRDKAIDDILTASDYHEATVSLALSLANENVPKNLLQATIEGLMWQSRPRCEAAGTVEDRWKPRFAEIHKAVESALDIIEEELKDSVAPYDTHKKASKYTKLSWPPGFLGVIAREVHRSMKFPNKEIAILAAHVAVAVFSGRRFSFEGLNVGLTYRLHAMMSVGKQTIRNFITAIVDALIDLDPVAFLHVTACLPPTITFGLKAIIDAGIQSPSYVAIWSEGGKAAQTKAGDSVSVDAFLMNHQVTKAHEPWTVPSYSKRIPHIYGVPATKVVESVKESDKKEKDYYKSGANTREIVIRAHHKPDARRVQGYVLSKEVVLGFGRLWKLAIQGEDFAHKIKIGNDEYIGPSILPVKHSNRLEFKPADDEVRARMDAYEELENQRRLDTPDDEDDFDTKDIIEWAQESRKEIRIYKIALTCGIAELCVRDEATIEGWMLDHAEKFIEETDLPAFGNLSEFTPIERQILDAMYDVLSKTLDNARKGKSHAKTYYGSQGGHSEQDAKNGIVHRSLITNGTPRYKNMIENLDQNEVRISGDKWSYFFVLGSKEGYWEHYPKGDKGRNKTREFIKLNPTKRKAH